MRCAQEVGHQIVPSNPFVTRPMAQAELKSDKFVASTLADLVKVGLVAKSYVRSKEVRDVRAPLRHRVVLVNTGTAVQNRIQATLTSRHMRFQGFWSLATGPLSQLRTTAKPNCFFWSANYATFQFFARKRTIQRFPRSNIVVSPKVLWCCIFVSFRARAKFQIFPAQSCDGSAIIS